MAAMQETDRGDGVVLQLPPPLATSQASGRVTGPVSSGAMGLPNLPAVLLGLFRFPGEKLST